jgi:glycosyltransferase involved in cell wall biosynthesis
MPGRDRTTLAFIEGFRRPAPARAQGTLQSAHLICQALANVGLYSAFDLYQDRGRNPAVYGELALPRTPPTRVFEKTRLAVTRDRYSAIYVANGDQIHCAPHVLRPKDDWAPVVCSVGTAHANGQWTNLLLSIASAAIRSTDGFIFKSNAAAILFRQVWDEWSERFGLSTVFPALHAVIPNGVDVRANMRSEDLRQQTRRRLRVHDDDIVYLSFSRLDPGMKGDLEALTIRWQEVLAKVPRALLVLSGASADRAYVTDLREVARAAGVGERTLILDNPYDLDPDARSSLMSAADVFIHLSTGVEETSALAVHEALAHSLPVIATGWAGMPEVVSPGETGFLIDTRAAPLGTHVATTLFGETDRTHLLHASRVVHCDWQALLSAALALAEKPLRESMGAAARRREEARDIGAVAREFVAFFDATSEAAQKNWTGSAPWQPLVNLNDVIKAQASGTLEGRQRIRLGDRARLSLLTQGHHPESPAQLACVLGLFDTNRTVSIEQAATAAAGFARTMYPTEFGSESDLAISARLLVRLLNCGALELD